MNQVIKKAIDLLGGQQKMADAISVSQSAVHKWLHNKIKISPENVVRIVEVTQGKVQGYDLRPDLPSLFPKPLKLTEEDLITCKTQTHAKQN